MKQIYNLLQTIEDDKQAVAACEKYLHYLKGQLAVHEEALTRITSVSSPAKEDSRVRITQDNWKTLGIEVGDTVEIVVSGDRDFADNSKYTVTELDYNANQSFLRLNGDWYYYDLSEEDYDELYLIKQTA